MSENTTQTGTAKRNRPAGYVDWHNTMPMVCFADGRKVSLSSYTGGAHPAGPFGELTLAFESSSGEATLREYRAVSVPATNVPAIDPKWQLDEQSQKYAVVLLGAVETVCAQAGSNLHDYVRWFTVEGGLSQMTLAAAMNERQGAELRATNLRLARLESFLLDDASAISHQTLGQYRRAALDLLSKST